MIASMVNGESGEIPEKERARITRAPGRCSVC
jgi:hypothetical protein